MPIDSSFSGVSLISLGGNDHIQVTIHRNRNEATDDDHSDCREYNPKNRFRSLFHRTFSRRRRRRRRRNSLSDANSTKQPPQPPAAVSARDQSSLSLILIRPRKQQQQYVYTDDDDDDVSRISTSSRLLPPPVTTPTAVQPPRRPVTPPRRHLSSTTFWAPVSLVPVLQALRAVGGYAGEIVTTNDLEEEEEEEEQVLVKETKQQPPEFVTLPTYIATTTARGRRYTEATCRDWFRAVCERVQVLHQHHTVHRNLHLSHVLYDPFRVRTSLPDVAVAGNTPWSWCVLRLVLFSLSHTHTLLHPCIS